MTKEKTKTQQSKSTSIIDLLPELKKAIPYRWKIQSINDKTGKATCVAYIDARDVMEVLDDVLGAQNWKDEYRVIEAPSELDKNGKEIVKKQLIGTLFIKIDGEWVGKEDTGKPSDYEAEKGWFSDTFKRAAVKWGIGRFLYEEDVKFVNTKNKVPVDEKGNRIWDLTDYFKKQGNGKAPKDAKTHDQKIDTLTKIKPAIDAVNGVKTEQELNQVVKDLVASKKYTGLEMSKVQTFVQKRREVLKGAKK